MDLNFHLITKLSASSRKEAKFFFIGKMLSGSGSANGWDKTMCSEVERRLIQVLPSGDLWNIWIKFNTTDFTGTWMTIEVYGRLLELLSSVMTYGVPGGAVQLYLQAATLKINSPNSNYFRTVTLEETLLTPTTPMKPRKYSARFRFVEPGAPPLQLGRISKWKLCGVQLVVKGTRSDLGSGVDNSPFLEAGRILWGKREGEGDLKIIGREGVPIPCHGSVLIDNCSVFKAMLEDGHFLEGRTGEIRMEDWGEDEILAFLAFLYCRNTEAAQRDPGIALSVLEMGHMYAFEMTSLEESMKRILLGMLPRSHSIAFAQRILEFGEEYDYPQLKLKGEDVLKWLEANPLLRIE